MTRKMFWKWVQNIYNILITFVVSKNTLESCTTPNSKLGECVTFQDCPELSHFTKDNITDDETNFLVDSRCNIEAIDYFVCCVEPRNSSTDATKIKNDTSNYLPIAPVCGIDVYDGLVGMNDTQICESPWMTLIQYTYRKFFFF